MTIAVKARWLLTGYDTAPLKDQVVLIDGDRISAVGPQGSVALPADAQMLDFGEGTLLPGLIDLHSHPTYSYRRPDANELGQPAYSESMITLCQGLGVKAVFYPCGDIVPRLEHIVEMAPDALAFEESKKTFTLDVTDVRSQVGDELCLFGNLDAYGDLEIASDESLRDEVERQVREGSVDGKRFVVSVGSPITLDTPPERVGAFIRMSRDVGRYPLQIEQYPVP